MVWSEVVLGKVVTLQRGYDLTEEDRVAGTVPVVTSSGITGRHDKAHAKGPGVVIGRYGTLGEAYYLRTDFWPHNTTLFAKDFHGNNPLFVYYLLKSLHLGRHNSASSVPGVNRNTLHTLKVRVPDRPVQERIAELLGALDDKIECNRTINHTLEQMAQTLYKHWFVAADGNGTRPFTNYIALDPPTQIRKGEVVPYVDMKALAVHSMSVGSISKRPYTSGSRFLNGDTLLARITPCLENGKTAFVDFLEDGQAGFGSTEFIVLRAKSGVNPYFAYCTARDDSFRALAIKSMVGSSGRQRVRADAFERFLVLEPTPEKMTAFENTVGPWFRQIRTHSAENSILVHTRDYLLPKLLSGEIEIKAAEAEVKAVA